MLCDVVQIYSPSLSLLDAYFCQLTDPLSLYARVVQQAASTLGRTLARRGIALLCMYERCMHSETVCPTNVHKGSWKTTLFQISLSLLLLLLSLINYHFLHHESVTRGFRLILGTASLI